jgi:ribosome-associated protein
LPTANNYLERRRHLEGLELAHLLVDTILNKKGANIILLDIRDEAVFTDYFLICNGDNDRQLRTLADSIADDAKKKAELVPWGREGEASSGWLLMDFGDLIVHLFSPEKRNYYRLEELWTNAHVVFRLQ